MKRIVYVWMMLLLGGFYACKEEKASSVSKTLEASIVKVDTAIYGSYIRAGYNGLFILALKSSFDWCYEVCQLRNDSLVKIGNFLSRGNGPYEAIRSYLHVSRDLNKLFVHLEDYRKTYCIPFPLEKNLFLKDTWTEINRPMPEDEFFWNDYSAQIVDDSTFIAQGAFYKENYMFSLMESNGKTTPMYELPLPDDGITISPTIKWAAYSHGEFKLMKRPGYNEYAYTEEDGSFLGTFKVVDKKIQDAKYILDEFPKYSARQDGINVKRNPNNKLGYKAVVTAKYIYLLASPYETRQQRADATDYMGYSSYDRNRLIVYTWNGERVGDYLLNIPINSYVVSDDDSYLYGYIPDPNTDDYIMVRYELPIN